MLKYLVLFSCCVVFFVESRSVIECNRPNEEYQCGSACQTTCANLGKTCPIVNIRCNDDCYCKEGFARDRSGTCIPVENCRR